MAKQTKKETLPAVGEQQSAESNEPMKDGTTTFYEDLEKLRTELEQRETAVSEKETQLAEKEQELQDFEQVLKEKETELEQRETAVSEKETQLAEKEQELHAFEQVLKEKEAELEQRENSKEQSSEPTAEGSVQFQFGEDTYRFRDDVPLRIRVFGKILTQEQIAQDEDVILQLVVGKSNLIEKV